MTFLDAKEKSENTFRESGKSETRDRAVILIPYSPGLYADTCGIITSLFRNTQEESIAAPTNL